MWPPKRWEIESGHIRISSWVQGERRRRRRTGAGPRTAPWGVKLGPVPKLPPGELNWGGEFIRGITGESVIFRHNKHLNFYRSINIWKLILENFLNYKITET
jgi:hypothetical protein